MSKIADEVRQAGSGSTAYANAETTGDAGAGPWPNDGSYTVELTAVKVDLAPFRYCKEPKGKRFEMPGFTVQFAYRYTETPDDGEGEWSGAIRFLPANMDESLSGLGSDLKIFGSKPSVEISLGQIKTGLTNILGRESLDICDDADEVNAMLDAGKHIVLEVGVRRNKTGKYPTDYINSATVVE